MPMMDLWKVRAQKAEAELAKCGRENCVGHEVEGCRSWVSKERLLQVQAEAESSAALVRKLAKNFELLYSEITTEQLKQQFNAEQFDGLIQAHRAAQSLLSDPAVEKLLEPAKSAETGGAN